MTARRRQGAYLQHSEFARAALSTVTRARLIGRRIGRPLPAYMSMFGFSLIQGASDIVPIRNRPALAVVVRETIVVATPEDHALAAHSRVIAYHYAVHGTNSQDLLTFQLHPDEASVEFFQLPHLHVGAGLARPDLTVAPRDVHKIHIPTGHVTLPMFVRMLIEEFGVEPLRDNWDALLRDNDAQLSVEGKLPDE